MYKVTLYIPPDRLNETIDWAKSNNIRYNVDIANTVEETTLAAASTRTAAPAATGTGAAPQPALPAPATRAGKNVIGPAGETLTQVVLDAVRRHPGIERVPLKQVVATHGLNENSLDPTLGRLTKAKRLVRQGKGYRVAKRAAG